MTGVSKFNICKSLRIADLKYYDADGIVYIIDRISEFINFRSINVSHAEIEYVLGSHTTVLHAMMIGISHEIDEQHPMAVVTLVPGKTVQTSKFKGRIKDNILIGPEIPLHKEGVNVAEMILKTLKSKPDFIGQVDAITGKQNTYAEMSERSIKCALWLKKQGVKSGDIVGLCTNNNLDAILVLLGTIYLGAISNTWDHELTLMTAKYFLSMTSPTIIFTIPLSAVNLSQAARELKMKVKIIVLGKLDGYESFEDILQDHDDREIATFKCTAIAKPDQVATIVLSSGTTGMPKGTEISHASLCNSMLPEFADMKGHTCLFMATIRWNYGILLAFQSIMVYSTRIVASYNDASDNDGADNVLCDYIEKYRVTWFATDTFTLIRFIKTNIFEKYPLSTLKEIEVAGAQFTKAHHEALAEKLPHVDIRNYYGSTDAGNGVTRQNMYSKPGSVGFPRYNVQLKVTDVNTGKALEANKTGELCVKVPFVMNGYYKNPEATKQAFDSEGWLRTGDRGYYDEDGEVYVIDRISQFILFQGVNVSPAEIEAVLQHHPAVLQAAVIGISHEIDEQRPMAIVSRVPGKTVTEQELVSFVEKNLPDYCKLRAGVKFLDQLPRTATGKIAKKQLQDMFAH